jgi:hypothetical protein
VGALRMKELKPVTSCGETLVRLTGKTGPK